MMVVCAFFHRYKESELFGVLWQLNVMCGAVEGRWDRW